MKIKVGNKIYDGENEPVMAIFNEQDKINIANMHPEANRYCVYPTEKHSEEDIKKWMVEDVEFHKEVEKP